MAKIDATIQAIEEKLKQAKARKQKMEAATKAAEAKALRSSLTQRKILLGAFLMGMMDKNPDYASQVLKGMDEFLTRDRERKIFGFKPLAPAPGAAAAAPAPAPRPDPAPAAPAPSSVKTYLTTGFSDKEAVKALGAQFDYDAKKWFVPPGLDLTPFKKWMV